MDNRFIISVLIFLAALFILEAVYYWWQNHYGVESKRLKRRIGALSNKTIQYESILKNRHQSTNPLLNFFYNELSGNKLDTVIFQSGLTWTSEQFIRYSGLSFILSLVISLMLNIGFILSFFLAVAFLFVPFAYVFYKRGERFAKFEEQLPDAIDSLCRSVRAGHTFNSAFMLIGEEFNEPIATEFRITMEQNNLGISMNDALHDLAERVPSTDLRYLVIALLIQRETGGNLAEILTNISQVIRERFKLQRHIKTISAEGRLSAKILGAMPVIMLGLLSVLNPSYAPLMFHSPEGIYYLKVGGVMMLIGIVWMQKIARIKI